MVAVDVSIRAASVQVDLSARKELASRLLGLRYARTLELEADRMAATMLDMSSTSTGEFASIKALAAAIQ